MKEIKTFEERKKELLKKGKEKVVVVIDLWLFLENKWKWMKESWLRNSKNFFCWFGHDRRWNEGLFCVYEICQPSNDWREISLLLK